MVVAPLLEVFGGLAIFMYGVQLLSSGLEKMAGSRLQGLLKKATDTPLKGSLFGAFATAVLQSSSLLMVTMIGLLNANLLTLEQAIGVMLGQEIGTTLTGQMVSLSLGDYFAVLLIAGAIMFFFISRLEKLGQTIFSVGLIFLGMNIMSGGAKVLSQDPVSQMVLLSLASNVMLGVAGGAVFTAIIQSSSAMTGLVIALGKANSISLPVAIALIFGANIGTCVTGVFASAKSSPPARRASLAQIFINIGGVIIFLPFITPFANIVAGTSSLLPRQIANAHTLFNVIVSIIMFPVIKPLSRMLTCLVPGGHWHHRAKTKYIDNSLLHSPSIALAQAKQEVFRLGHIALRMLESAKKGFLNKDTEAAEEALDREQTVDELSYITGEFLNKIPEEKISFAEMNLRNSLKQSITDMERVGDLAKNLAEAAKELNEKKIPLTAQARKELETIFNRAAQAYSMSIDSLDRLDAATAKKVLELEDEVDSLEKRFKAHHVQRLKKGICSPDADPFYVESLRNLERVSDHADNIAQYVIELSKH